MKLRIATTFAAAALLMMMPMTIPAEASSQTQMPQGYVVLKALPLPNINFYDSNNRLYSLQDFKGKVIVLNFWATWCAPCVKELPSLKVMAERLKDKNVVVIALSQDKGGVSVARGFLERIGLIDFSFYSDSTGRAFRQLDVRGLPTTFVIDADGNAVGRLEGFADWSAESTINFIGNVAPQ